MYDYNRMGAGAAAYDEKEDHKKHIGLAVVLAIGSACWITAYSHYLKLINENDKALGESWCCTWTDHTGDVTGPYLCAQPVSGIQTKTHVTAEFHAINAGGVALMTILLVVALGHCIKPFRCFTKIFGTIIWVAYICYFIAANVYRFRVSGRICSLEPDYMTTTCEGIAVGAYEWCNYRTFWQDEGVFQWRSLVAVYILSALGALVACIAAFCHKRKQRNMY